MQLDFGSSGLEAVFTDKANKLKFPVAVVQSLRRKLTLLESAPDERTLRNWKSLHYEKLQGDRAHQRSIRINDQWRLVFELRVDPSAVTLLLIGVEDYH